MKQLLFLFFIPFLWGCQKYEEISNTQLNVNGEWRIVSIIPTYQSTITNSIQISNSDFYALSPFVVVSNNVTNNTMVIKNDTTNIKPCFFYKNGYVWEFDYNNLINLCIMVKNAGPQFEQMLLKNLPIIDRWTILDTGSTDDTIEIINRVLVGKKNGTLYQEPFINFRDSRNRLLDLAGTSCKYNIMLDDTYVVEGDLRQFLTEIRGDQYANSFTLYIHSDDTKYGSNRITISTYGLRYIHKIHEVITDKDNINVVIPENKVWIEDRRFDYMEKRTMERKQLDLKLLYEEVEENPQDPRAYYYLAQTYNMLGDYENAYKYFLKHQFVFYQSLFTV